MYNLIYATVQGFEHIKHQIPCEDSGLIYETEYYRIFTVADGHGDSNCPRSKFGSETACRIAVEEMDRFSLDIQENGWESKLLSEGKESEALVRQLVTSIVAKWIKTVNEDIESNPLTEEERNGCDRYLERYDKGERLEHIYGTTLIAALYTEKYLLLIQQGDGRCVIFDQKGSVTQPIPWDDRCFANVTTSLCDEDAIQRFRFCAIDVNETPIIACMAGSDGVEDSFPSMDMMYVFYRDLLIYASENGAEALNEHLEEILPDFSRNGSGDDVTICGIVDADRIAVCAPTFKRDNEIVSKENELHALEERLKSMNGMGKMDALKNKYEEALSVILNAEQELQSATEKLDCYMEDLRQIQQDEEDGSERLKIWNRLIDTVFPGARMVALEEKTRELQEIEEQAEQRLHQAQEELIPIEEEYREYMARKEELESKIEETKLNLEKLREADTSAT